MAEPKIQLFIDKRDCCGCGACVNACSKQAISMKNDEFGFRFPAIDETKCVRCGKCKTVCAYQNPITGNKTIETYACATKNRKLLFSAASGGAFAQIATCYLEDGGVVYGAALTDIGGLQTKHIRVSSVEDLFCLLGSKYVQSDMDNVYQAVKQDLIDGKHVLFSGTPCQVASVKKYLGKDYDNLILLDIICHGVPSQKFFSDFLQQLGKKQHGTISEFSFRNKSKGQGMTSAYKVKGKNGEREHICNGKVMSYFSLFLKSYTYRENCYSCPYAKSERMGDLTLGDFWGFHQEHPGVTILDNEKGISCVLVNTEKGKNLFEKYSLQFERIPSSFEKIDAHNDQLHEPSKKPEKRDVVFALYRDGGYEAVEKYYQEKFRKDRIKQTIIYLIPKKGRKIVQKILGYIKKH